MEIGMAFNTEKDLLGAALTSRYFKAITDEQKPPYGYFELEPRGLFGIPDVVVAQMDFRQGIPSLISTYAFELKLSNWKRALAQAFRYRTFAHRANVLLDQAHIRPALANIELFRRSNVGLLTIDDTGQVSTYFEPVSICPYSDQLFGVFKSLMLNRHMDAQKKAIISPSSLTCSSVFGFPHGVRDMSVQRYGEIPH
jgi:hypothetical protein